jgi:hypothetical protein
MDDKNKELLAGFHHTISEQLDSRLSESPKFFGLLVVVSTGYGYVLSNPCLSNLLLPTTLLALAATFWATWYLAALGYAFRFLQSGQHRIEQELGWTQYTRVSGKPPEGYWNPFWLLPGIYHAHAAGLSAFFTLICFIGLHGQWRWIGSMAGVFSVVLTNLCYLIKFKRQTATR